MPQGELIEHIEQLPHWAAAIGRRRRERMTVTVARVEVQGLKQLLRDVRKVERIFRRRCGNACCPSLRRCRTRARRRGQALGGVQAHAVRRGLRAGATQNTAWIKLVGTREPTIFGAEFGGGRRKTTRQFPPWRGSGGGAGYFVYPTIRGESGDISDELEDAVQDSDATGRVPLMARDITIRYVGDSASAERAAQRVRAANDKMSSGFASVSESASENFRKVGSSLTPLVGRITTFATLPIAGGFAARHQGRIGFQRAGFEDGGRVRHPGRRYPQVLGHRRREASVSPPRRRSRRPATFGNMFNQLGFGAVETAKFSAIDGHCAPRTSRRSTTPTSPR